MRILLLGVLVFCLTPGFSQKKPLDHTVYDGWESIAERQLSHNGQWIAFTVTPQEGDASLLIMRTNGADSMRIPRGYDVQFTPDSRLAVFKIKPTYAQVRDARIKKKRPDDMPKDTLGWLTLGETKVQKVPRVRLYKMPEEANWLVYHKEKALPDTTRKPAAPKADPKLDSARKVIDSLQALLQQLPEKVRKKYGLEKDAASSDDSMEAEAMLADADEPETAGTRGNETGGDLVWLDWTTGQEKTFKNIMDFAIDSIGGKSLVLETGKIGKDSLAKVRLIWVDIASGRADTLSRDLNDVKFMRLDEKGNQLAFLAEKDSSAKALDRFYALYHYRKGNSLVTKIADRNSPGKTAAWKISDMAAPRFSKSGNRIFLGVAPILPPKDTSLPEFERVSVDVWHYNEDYLQPQQLRNLNRDLNRSYLAVYHVDKAKLVQLADETLSSVQTGMEGDLPLFAGTDDRAYRVAAQWNGGGTNDVYMVNPETGQRSLVVKGLQANPQLSADGQYLYWYDAKKRHYFTWKNGILTNISSKVKTALYDEDNDVPAEPGPYGIMGWHQSDEALYVYDRFDVWKLDPAGKMDPVCITRGEGRKSSIQIRHVRLDPVAERKLQNGQQVLFSFFNERDKTSGVKFYKIGEAFAIGAKATQPHAYAGGGVTKSKFAFVLSYGIENFDRSGDVRVALLPDSAGASASNGMPGSEKILFQPNKQQSSYNWMTAELIEWKAYDGKMTQGILYKPENFDPAKKYPLIAYFYETVSDGLYRYSAPAPTPSRLNIPFFVSRGYLVLAPDIHYKTGQPAQDAYDYIVSGVRHVVKMGIADSSRLGIQGQSWGGIQVAQLVTMTTLFKAAWAGAPVANMTSAYGGIRWESGLNRQFQYEKTQSRIGATLWEKPELYIRNSPLFHLPKVQTPLVIMHNDADGAVPWYQGIELFTGLRRLQKPVWMLNYNGEAHNLVERRNRKDIQIREQQFFDWLLMGQPAPKWIKEGVPAIMKGRDLGLGY